MCSTHCSSNIDTKHHRQSPSKRNNNPLICKWYWRSWHSQVREKDKGRDTTIAKEDQYHRTQEFGNTFSQCASEGIWSLHCPTCHNACSISVSIYLNLPDVWLTLL